MTLGAGSTATPYIMPAVENINGQAIVLSNEHLDKRDPSQWKGFTFGVPFEYSMHNFLLRYYVAEFGLDPDVDTRPLSSANDDRCAPDGVRTKLSVAGQRVYRRLPITCQLFFLPSSNPKERGSHAETAHHA